MTTTIVEFDPLPDAVRAAAQNDRPSPGLWAWPRKTPCRPAGFHRSSTYRRLGEGNSAAQVSIRLYTGRTPRLRRFRRDLRFRDARQSVASRRIGEAHGFADRRNAPFRLRQAMRADFGLQIDDFLEPREKPRVDTAQGMDLLVIDPCAAPGPVSKAVRRWRAERRPDDIFVVAFAESFQYEIIEPA